MDRAQQCRDQLLEQHDRQTADAIVDGRPVPPMDPRVNLSELSLRRASGEARAAAKAREGVIDEIASLNSQLSTIAAELEEQIWATVPRAAAQMFEDVAELQRRRDRILAQIDSVAMHAHEVAHQQRGNGAPEQHPAYRAWAWFRSAVAALTTGAGDTVSRDFRTGPALVEAVSRGEATLGDVSR
jgi:hypothetical protein